MVKISVIIPVYNAEKYLSNTLDCLLTQTLKEIEVICINDNSKDSSLEILKEYAKKDDRLKIIDLKENMGAAVARNKGLEIAQGEYLGFVDSDDEIDLNFYEELYKKAVETCVDIVKAGCKTVELDGSTSISSMNGDIEKNSQYHFVGEWWCAIYRAKLIFENNILFPEECPKGQDCVFLNRAVLKANNVETVNDVFYHYIRRECSLDSEMLSRKAMLSTLKAKQLIAEDINNSDLFDKDKNSYIYCYYFNYMKYIMFFFRTNDLECKSYISKLIIDGFNQCKDVNSLKNMFNYRWMLQYLEDKKYNELREILLKYKTMKELKYPLRTFLQKLFSVVDMGDKYVIWFLGIRLKLKKLETFSGSL